MGKKEFGGMDGCTDGDVRLARFCSWGVIILLWVSLSAFPFIQGCNMRDIAEMDRKSFLKQLEDTKSSLDKVHQKILIVESLNPRP